MSGTNGKLGKAKQEATSNGQANGPPIDASPLDTALWALKAGLWPIPITSIDDKTTKHPGKAPVGKAWGKTRWTPERLRAIYASRPGIGVGLKLGSEGRVIDIDVDVPELARPHLVRMFPDELPPTLGWTNAGDKFHLTFVWDDRFARYGKPIIKGWIDKNTGEHKGNPNYLGLEIRIGAASGVGLQYQSVIPPSLMTGGTPRRWNENDVILPAPESLFRDLDEHALTFERDEVLQTIGTQCIPLARDLGVEFTSSGPNDEGWWECRAIDRPDNNPSAGINEGSGVYKDFGSETSLSLIDWAMKLRPSEFPDVFTTINRLGLRFGVRPSSGKAKDRTNGKAGSNAKGEINGHVERHDQAISTVKILVSHREHETTAAAVEALARDPTVYQRGNVLVTVLRDPAPAKAVIRPAGSPRIAVLSNPRLRERSTIFGGWVKLLKDQDGTWVEVPTHPPDWAIPQVAARGDYPGIRPIESVIDGPILRPDGSVIETPGYDPATGLLYEPNARFTRLNPNLSRDLARRAAAELLKLVKDFPFKGDAHRAAWLAALLTPFARFAFAGPCPLFLFDANAPGSGKSLLCDIIAMIATGRAMPRTAYPDKDEEMRKRITSIALAGDRLMLLDNIATTFGGSSLDAALTGTIWRDRILGRSEMTSELPLFTVWFASGNNIALRGDAIRRIVCGRLEVLDEKPEERTGFDIPRLLEHVEENRARYTAAALAILRAFVAAGRPTTDIKLKPFGSFEGWSDLVRSAVAWATDWDPCGGRDELRANDPETNARAALVEGWAELPGSNNGLTVAEALKLVKDNPERYSTLHAVLMAWSKTNDLPSPQSVGMRVNAIKGRVVGNRSIHNVPDSKVQSWKIVTIKAHPTGGTNGTNGTKSTPRTGPPHGSDGGGGGKEKGNGISGEWGSTSSVSSVSSAHGPGREVFDA